MLRQMVTNPRHRSIFATRLISSTGAGEQPQVLVDMRAAILRGDEPPGTLIPIDAVAAFFRVSQIPVREALRALVAEGLVEHRPNVGYRVAAIGFDEFCELYDVRQALEVAALRDAVRLACLADDEHVRAVHASMHHAIEADDERGFHAESRRFHMALIAPCDKKRLLQMYESAWNITEPVRPMSHVPGAGRVRFHQDHEDMLEAFVARDADALVEHSRGHYANLMAAIRELAPYWPG